MAAPHPHPLESDVLRTELGRVCAPPRQQANLLVRHFVRASRATLPYTAPARRAPLLPGGWKMDRPFAPYELDVAIRDSSLGSAPGPDKMLNEFLHRLGPVAQQTYNDAPQLLHKWQPAWLLEESRTIFAFPTLGKNPCRPESCRPIKSLSALLQLTERMIHRRLSALLPHRPRQFGFAPSRSTSDVVKLVIDKLLVD
ncbi:hypothetical protein TcCL_Unassigned04118 [Trypanosoma cruzi]|nr:hypothetical protein TcCL_Unassigned04118 [Trypanosoma cruzi]